VTRPNFDVTINGTVDLYRGCGEIHNDHYVGTYTNAANRSREVTTGVSRRKPTGFLNPTAYTFEKVRTDYASGRCLYRPVLTGGSIIHQSGQDYRGIVAGVNGRFSGDSHFDATLGEATVKNDAGLGNTALIAVRLKLKSTDINLGVAFGERKQTARLLGSNATRIGNAFRHLRGGKTRRAMDELGISSRRRQPRGSNVPAKWLELQYGWKPLLSDVYGAAKALEGRPKGDWRVTAKVTKSREDTWVVQKLPAPTSNFDAHRCEARLFRSVFARIDALPQNEAIISLASLGVTNPLSVAWELVPYSFVVDWCIPIGGWLESLDALLGYGTTSYSSSFLAKAKWDDRGLSGGGSTWKTSNNFRGTKRMVYLNRSVSSSVPLPSIPRFKDPRSLGHMANGLSLLATAFGRRRR
jgi:hypothetical protein